MDEKRSNSVSGATMSQTALNINAAQLVARGPHQDLAMFEHNSNSVSQLHSSSR